MRYFENRDRGSPPARAGEPRGDEAALGRAAASSAARGCSTTTPPWWCAARRPSPVLTDHVEQLAPTRCTIARSSGDLEPPGKGAIVDVYLRRKRVRIDPSACLGKGGEADVFDLGGGTALKIWKTPEHPDYSGPPVEQQAARELDPPPTRTSSRAFPRGLPGARGRSRRSRHRSQRRARGRLHHAVRGGRRGAAPLRRPGGAPRRRSPRATRSLSARRSARHRWPQSCTPCCPGEDHRRRLQRPQRARPRSARLPHRRRQLPVRGLPLPGVHRALRRSPALRPGAGAAAPVAPRTRRRPTGTRSP